MNLQNKNLANQERLEVLLAMTIASLNQNKFEPTDDSAAAERSLSEQILQHLAALNDNDFSAMREKVGYYDALTDEEKRLWQARILSQISSRNQRLDGEVHHTQIAAALSVEPDYISEYVMQRLPPDMAHEVAADLGRDDFAAVSLININADLENLLRRRFLSNFVGRDDLYELKPLAMLTREDVLDLVQRLGRIEMAFVCRGVKDVESLAPFLRRFEPEDSQAILELMANLRTVEKARLDKAELLVKEAWAAEKHPTLIIQSVGLTKLAAALCEADEMTVRYTLQKMPTVLSVKVSEKIQRWRERDFDTEVYQSEVETVAARILLDAMPQNNLKAEEDAQEEIVEENENSPLPETVEAVE